MTREIDLGFSERLALRVIGQFTLCFVPEPPKTFLIVNPNMELVGAQQKKGGSGGLR